METAGFSIVNAVMAVVFAFLSSNALSASTTILDRTLSIRGPIESGDAERVARYISSEPFIVDVELDSLGGDLVEAMKIASLIKAAQYDVSVKIGGYCASSCFFIYLAGHTRRATGALPEDGNPPKDEKHLGFLGIHRPYFKNPEGSLASAKKQEAMMEEIKKYLVVQGVYQYLIDEMMSHPSNDIYWLTDADVEKLGKYTPGDEEALIARCGYKRPDRVVAEKWDRERRNAVIKCASWYQHEAYGSLRESFISKLRTGWRPWRG